MKSTIYDYFNLGLFILLSPLSTILFILSITYSEKPLLQAGFAIIFAFFAMFLSSSVTKTWLNHLYKKATSHENIRFYGRISDLEYYQIQAGECVRGATLLTLLFIVPSILIKNWLFVTLFISGAAVFLVFAAINVRHFKQYLSSHLTTKPNK